MNYDRIQLTAKLLFDADVLATKDISGSTSQPSDTILVMFEKPIKVCVVHFTWVERVVEKTQSIQP